MNTNKLLTQHDIRIRIFRAMNAAGGHNELADCLGITSESLSDMILGKNKLSDEILTHVGIERVTNYYGQTGWKP